MCGALPGYFLSFEWEQYTCVGFSCNNSSQAKISPWTCIACSGDPASRKKPGCGMTWCMVSWGVRPRRDADLSFLEIDHSPRPHPQNTPKALVIPRRLVSDKIDYPRCGRQSMRKKSSQEPLRRGISSMVRLSRLCESVISHTISHFCHCHLSCLFKEFFDDQCQKANQTVQFAMILS